MTITLFLILFVYFTAIIIIGDKLLMGKPTRLHTIFSIILSVALSYCIVSEKDGMGTIAILLICEIESVIVQISDIKRTNDLKKKEQAK